MLEDPLQQLEEMRQEAVFTLIDHAEALPAPEGVPLALYAARMAPDVGEVYAAAARHMRETSDEALFMWLAAVGLGKLRAGPRLEASNGEAWSEPDCRPFLRAQLGYARCCFSRGEQDTAIAELKRLLSYDQNDHLGARYLLAVVLLAAARFKAFAELRNAFAGDRGAYWLWVDAYHAVRTNKRSVDRKEIVDRALAANTHVPELLNSVRPPDARSIEHYRIGSPEEALAFAASEGGKLWRNDRRALETLNRHWHV